MRTPFEPYITVETAKYKELEKVIHHELNKLTDFRTRENREFFEIDPIDAASLLDDVEIVEYGNFSSVEEKGASTITQQGNRTTFKMLGVPVGGRLTAANKDILDAIVYDEINQV